jgi:hypothetical protein
VYVTGANATKTEIPDASDGSLENAPIEIVAPCEWLTQASCVRVDVMVPFTFNERKRGRDLNRSPNLGPACDVLDVAHGRRDVILSHLVKVPSPECIF